MRGVVRPCREHLGPELFTRWQAHLCGLCLTLRDVAGQAQRALTGYDVLLLSVLVEAQAGAVETTTAARCPLRGFSRATVVASTTDAARLAAAGALLTGGAGLADKVDDGDLPRPTRRAAGHIAVRLARGGVGLAGAVGLDPRPVLGASKAAAAAEVSTTSDLDALLAPTGEAVGALFAHTAVVAGRPGNAAALAACGRAFGRLVHLLDAVEDLHEDQTSGAFNPLVATGTGEPEARALAAVLVAGVQAGLERAELVDRVLVDVLLGRELERAVHRVLPGPDAPCAVVPAQREARQRLPAAALALWAVLVPAVFVGGSYGGGACGPRRRRHGYGGHGRAGYGAGPGHGYGYGPRGYPPPGYGGYRVRSVGPGCGQLLACNCCANLACNACCCGNQCANG
jgi:hypothetical protein